MDPRRTRSPTVTAPHSYELTHQTGSGNAAICFLPHSGGPYLSRPDDPLACRSGQDPGQPVNRPAHPITPGAATIGPGFLLSSDRQAPHPPAVSPNFTTGPKSQFCPHQPPRPHQPKRPISKPTRKFLADLTPKPGFDSKPTKQLLSQAMPETALSATKAPKPPLPARLHRFKFTSQTAAIAAAASARARKLLNQPPPIRTAAEEKALGDEHLQATLFRVRRQISRLSDLIDNALSRPKPSPAVIDGLAKAQDRLIATEAELAGRNAGPGRQSRLQADRARPGRPGSRPALLDPAPSSKQSDFSASCGQDTPTHGMPSLVVAPEKPQDPTSPA